MRDFWRGEHASLAEFASRITGSSDLYEHSDRRPTASINFVVAHDGFTLRDLVSYNEKHNQANGEGGDDGESHNRSWNCGVEGETDDPAINALRCGSSGTSTTMMVSQGVPMLAHGDELGRTQRGNNNVYAQDNELSWVDWISMPTRRICWLSRRRRSACVRLTRYCGAGGFRRRCQTRRQERAGRHLVVQTRCLRDGRGRLELRIRPQSDGLPQR